MSNYKPLTYEQTQRRGLTRSEHFNVDAPLIEAWASMKSFRRKYEPPPSSGPGHNDSTATHLGCFARQGSPTAGSPAPASLAC
jgi:hypothetical protein